MNVSSVSCFLVQVIRLTRSPVSFSNEQFNTMVEPDPSDTFISVGELAESAMIPNGEENVCGIQNIVCNIYHLIKFYMYLSKRGGGLLNH